MMVLFFLKCQLTGQLVKAFPSLFSFVVVVDKYKDDRPHET